MPDTNDYWTDYARRIVQSDEAQRILRLCLDGPAPVGDANIATLLELIRYGLVSADGTTKSGRETLRDA